MLVCVAVADVSLVPVLCGEEVSVATRDSVGDIAVMDPASPVAAGAAASLLIVTRSALVLPVFTTSVAVALENPDA